jgi:type I restriction enzyme S subunit
MVALGDVAEFINGAAFKPTDWEEDGRRIIRIQNLTDPGKPYNRTTRDVATKYEVLKGTLLVSWSASLGVFEWPYDDVAVLNQHIFKVVPNKEKVDQGYLRHMLDDALVSMQRYAHGSTMIHVNRGEFLSTKIPLPPLPKQKRIVAILDQADYLRRKALQADERFSGLGSALFWDTFVSKRSEEWPTVRVDTLVNRSRGGMRTGPFGSQLLHAEFVDAGISVLGIDNAVSNEFRWAGRRFITPEKYSGLKRYKVYPGDVLITIMGTCGRCAIVPSDIGEAINTKHLCCITLDGEKCIPEYLYYYFLYHPEATKHLARQSKGAIMQGLNMGIIKDLPVVLPPISIQAEFARRIQGMSAEKAKIDAAKSAAEALFTSLQHRAFRGEL